MDDNFQEERAVENTKRNMDKALLTMDALKQKNLLLDLVDKIVMRQNTDNIPLHFDSFQNETSSRKVLRELLGEFHMQAEDLKKKINKNDEGVRQSKSQVDKITIAIKKLSTQCEQVVSFGKRVTLLENKLT